MLIVTREYLISLLDAWKENKITAVDLYETANKLYYGSIETKLIDWEIDDGSEESVTNIVLEYLESLDINVITQDDIEPCKEFLRTPIGKLDEGYKKWRKYIETINHEERMSRLRGTAPDIS
jgi:hypothetical protein